MPILTGPPGNGGTWRMQELSFAYIKAIGAASDCAVEEVRIDRESADLALRWNSNAGKFRSPRLEVQVKATYQQCVGATDVKFALKRKNYEDLAATDISVPRILVVLSMPRNIEDWIAHSEAELALRKCAYWISLYGYPDIGTGKSRMVYIPRRQVFDVDGLHQIFLNLSNGMRP